MSKKESKPLVLVKWHDVLEHHSDQFEPLPIVMPPCQVCRFWFPVVDIEQDEDNGPFPISVTCCHAPEMYDNFGCFLPGEEYTSDSDN